MEKKKFEKTVYSEGIVCYNTNNHSYCIVLDGNRGKENDRESLVIEMISGKLMTHQPCNRCLIPTGEYFDISTLKKILKGAQQVE